MCFPTWTVLWILISNIFNDQTKCQFDIPSQTERRSELVMEELAVHVEQAPFKSYLTWSVWPGSRKREQSRSHETQSWVSPCIVTWLLSNVATSFITQQHYNPPSRGRCLTAPRSAGWLWKLNVIPGRDCHGDIFRAIYTFRAKPNYLRVIFHTPDRTKKPLTAIFVHLSEEGTEKERCC